VRIIVEETLKKPCTKFETIVYRKFHFAIRAVLGGLGPTSQDFGTPIIRPIYCI